MASIQLEGGRHKFLGAEEAIEKMTVHSGMKVNVFASEEQFSDLANPVQSAVDTDGRLWVAAWPTYPHWNFGVRRFETHGAGYFTSQTQAFFNNRRKAGCSKSPTCPSDV